MRQFPIGTALLAAIVLPAMLAASTGAFAREDAPWCAVYPTDMGRTASCSFQTRAECLAGVRGIGTCEPNSSSHAKATHSDRRHSRH
jgi:hypothetical protein